MRVNVLARIFLFVRFPITSCGLFGWLVDVRLNAMKRLQGKKGLSRLGLASTALYRSILSERASNGNAGPSELGKDYQMLGDHSDTVGKARAG
jgi:hypothetical protein